MSKQVSQARIEANRRNAQHSTGPRTAAGKAQSCQNAITHGLFIEPRSPNPSIPAAVTGPIVHDAHAVLLAAFTESCRPVDPLENALVARLASLQHRLHRITTIESGTFDQAMTSILEYHPEHAAPGQTTFGHCLAAPKPALLADAYGRASKTLNLLSFYEARLSRDFQRTLNELRRAQALRQEASPGSVDPVLANDAAAPPGSENRNEKTNPTANQILDTANISTPELVDRTEHSSHNEPASGNERKKSAVAIPPTVNAETAPTSP